MKNFFEWLRTLVITGNDAYKGFGAILKMSDMDAVTPVFTAIGEIKEGPEGPSYSRDTIETTSHESPLGYKEFMGSLRDAGEVTFSINWKPDDPTHDPTTGLVWAYHEDYPIDFQLIFPDPDATQCDFSAIVTGFTPASPLDDVMNAGVTLKIVGRPIWDAP